MISSRVAFFCDAARMRRLIVVLCVVIFGATASAQATSPAIYVVLFETDDIALGQTQKAVVDQFIADFHQFGGKGAIVTGHYDRTGSPDHRTEMSRRFAEAIKAQLVANGLPEEAIAVSWRGDAELAVPTADGVYELANRYVTIEFSAD